MNITEIKTITLPLSSLHENTGQIEGVHANPRVLRDEKYRALVKSLKEDNLTGVLPLKIYDNGGEWVVLGGNMRLKALQEIGAKECACIVIPQETPAETLNKIVIVDNSTFGEWDMDMLANEWDVEDLTAWGVELPDVGVDTDALIEQGSSDAAVKDFSDDVNYDLNNLYRQRVSEDISAKIDEGIRGGKFARR